MIAGVLPERRWPSTGLTSATWLERPVQWFALDALWASQPGVYWQSLLGPEPPPTYSGDCFPHVVIWQGRTIIEDGHHRVMRALLDGQTHVQARWIELA